jgi:aldose 1-epimerase
MFSRSSGVYGSLNGEDVMFYKVCNQSGMSFTVVTYGATVTSVVTPDRNGTLEEVTLNYSNIEDMVKNHGPYYGCVAGRVANRIAKGKFSLGGVDYSVAVNNGENHLHGGVIGFDQKLWAAKEVDNGAIGTAGVEFQYLSADLEENFPGALQTSVLYELTSDNRLLITYKATVAEKATPINLTNHTYCKYSVYCNIID